MAKVSDFLEKLDRDPNMQRRWNNRGQRKKLLQDEQLSGDAIDALMEDDVPKVESIIKEEKGQNVFVYRYIK